MRKVIFRDFGIRSCEVCLHRLEEKDIAKTIPKRLLKFTGTARSNSNISWFPASSTIQKTSIAALSSLVNYQNQNAVAGSGAYIFFVQQFLYWNVQNWWYKYIYWIYWTGAGKSKPKKVTNQRAKHCEPTEHEQLVEANKNIVGMTDMRTEFLAKFNSPNRGLKPSSVRHLRELPPTNTPPTIFDEFKAKLKAKFANKWIKPEKKFVVEDQNYYAAIYQFWFLNPHE